MTRPPRRVFAALFPTGLDPVFLFISIFDEAAPWRAAPYLVRTAEVRKQVRTENVLSECVPEIFG